LPIDDDPLTVRLFTATLAVYTPSQFATSEQTARAQIAAKGKACLNSKTVLRQNCRCRDLSTPFQSGSSVC
jgi:hypothetical protein